MRKLLGALGVLGTGLYILSVLSFRQADASRNSSGTYSLFTPGNPVVGGTVGSSTWANNTLNDISTEITSSLDRSGRGGMLAPMRGVDGTLAAPAYSFTSETGSGLWRNGAGDVRMSILGALVGQWTANGLRVASGVVATPGLSFTSETGTGWYRNGAGDIRFAVSGADKQFLSASGLGLGAASPHASSPLFSVGQAFSFTAQSRSGVDTRLGSNIYFNGSNDIYNATGFAGYLQMPSSTGDYVFYTAPSGSAAATASTTERFRIANAGGITIASPGILVGIPTDGSGFKHKRVASCTTPASASSTCDTTVTWGTAFADANYTVTCSGEGSPSGTPLAVGVASKTASAVTYRISCQTALASSFTNIDCVAVHD